jgi:hydrophobic/amphiphilic exporter-1 (mainly G- bacteria), HAE1 family
MIKFFVNRKLFTVSIFSILMLFGLFSLMNLPLDFLPKMDIPTLTIMTPYPGASAEDIETTVSKVIEDAVATVPNIDKITSDSVENYSTVTINFKWGTDLSAASADVRDKIDQITSKLPDDIQPSTIYKFDLSQIPILILGVTADRSYKDLYHLVDKKISQDLKKIQGVGMVSFSGGLERQINVDVDRKRLEAYQMSLGQVNAAISRANMNVPAGSIKLGKLEYGIRIPGEFNNVEEIADTMVGSYQGRNVYVSDVARVTDSFKETTNMIEVNGQAGMRVLILKESGANSVNVAKTVIEDLARIQSSLPQDIKITVIMNTGESISNQIGELTRTLGWSFLFVILTVLFFLRNVRGSLIVSMAIPFSLIAAFIYLFTSGNSINIISLASIIIAIGIVVDDAIVILENIYRHREEKHEPPKEASIYGAGEVSGAVIASTTTNMVIFLPLLLVGGFIGMFFEQLSIITIVVIGMSLVTAMTLTPMLCSVLLEVNKKGGKTNKFFEKSEEIFTTVEENYSKLLGWALDNRRKIIIGGTLLFLLSMFMFRFVGSEFFPDQDSGTFSANVSMPPGTRWEETASAMRRIETEVKEKVPELEFIMVAAGSTGSTNFFGGKNGPNYGTINIKVVPVNKRKRGIKEIERVVADIAYSIPGLKSIDYSSSGANALTGSDKPVTIELYGPDFVVLENLADDLKTKISRVPGVIDPTISREKANPEYALKVDREKASSLGLTMADISAAVRGGLYGDSVSKYREGGDEYDIYTRFKEDDRKTIDDVKNALITTMTGKNISLGNIAKVEPKYGPQLIQRKNQQRLVKVMSDVYGRSLGEVVGDVKTILAQTTIPSEVTVKIGGSAESMRESFSRLGMALILGLCLLYLVMVAQFESLIDPFVIMFAIPFAVVGVVWSLFLTGKPFGIMPFIGLIMVTGVAVKNSIVLVDFINILRERGMDISTAIKEAGKTRLRPILMTSSTAILGLLPIVFNVGESGGFWNNMAISVIGGLMVSASISLLFVPCVYYIIETRMELRRKKKLDKKVSA